MLQRSGGEADLKLVDGDKVVFGGQELEVLETPGHTEGREAGRDKWID